MIGSLPKHVSAPDPEQIEYRSNNYVVVDFETTTEYVGSPIEGSNRIVLACWRLGPDHPRMDVDDISGPDGVCGLRVVRAGEFGMGDLVEDIELADYVVAHNAKFELGWLRRCGVDLYSTVVYDTQIAEYVHGGNRYKLRHLALNACLERHGLAPKEDLVSLMIKKGYPVEDIPPSWLEKYCIRDVLGCEELFNVTRVTLQNAGLMPVMYQRCMVTPCLADIEFNGLQLDPEFVKEEYERQELVYNNLLAELTHRMGGETPSGKALVEYIYGTLKFAVPKDYRGREIRTPKGEFSVSAEAIERLRPHNKKQEEFIQLYSEYRTAETQLSKVLGNFKKCCDEAGGRLHGQFNQCNTGTHRFSSSGVRFGVQLQNLNRSYKPAFTARHAGWVVGESDGAQLEFRVAVHAGRDAEGLSAIVNGVDIHAFTASVLSEAGQPTDRQGAKAHTFKPLYGGNSGTEAERTYYAAFKEKYDGVARAQSRWIESVLQHKRLRTECGLVFYWPDARPDPRTGYVSYTSQICNYPVQNLATAEIIPISLVAAWHRIKSAGLRMFLVNTVHDSIIAEMPPEEIPQWHELAEQCLIEDTYRVMEHLYGVRLTVPLGAGVKVASHWSGRDASEWVPEGIEHDKGEVVYTARRELWQDAAVDAGMMEAA